MTTSRSNSMVLITGGAGFVGTNLAHRLLSDGRRVLILDNLSRPGVERNLRWLCRRYPERLQIEIADILNAKIVCSAVERASEVYHLAGQVAVTTSLESPIHDFEVNARGTLNVLDAARLLRRPPRLVFTSTNKVYGALSDLALERIGNRYVPQDPAVRAAGIDELRPLDFHSPYGCSKGAADQYVLDYARCFGLSSVVFRMSCIYGPYQFGTEDQGWIAHFLMRAREQEPLTIFGDGCQVRDVLFVEDLVDALLLAMEHADDLAGQAFNVGGGPENTLSLLELVDAMSDKLGLRPQVQFSSWRGGDQRYYVSDTRKLTSATGWHQRTSIQAGLEKLNEWLGGSMARVTADDRSMSVAVAQ